MRAFNSKKGIMTTQNNPPAVECYKGELAIWEVPREDGMHVVVGTDDLGTMIADFGRVSFPKGDWASGGQENYMAAERAKNCWNAHDAHVATIGELREALKLTALKANCACDDDHPMERRTCPRCVAQSTLAKSQAKGSL